MTLHPIAARSLTLDDLETGAVVPLVRSAVRRRLPRSLRDQHEDLVQQALVRVTHAYRRDPDRSLNRSYLGLVAHSVVRDALRRSRRERVFPATPELRSAPACRTSDPERVVGQAQAVASIRAGLARLSDARRSAVQHYLIGHSIREVADAMDIGVKSAENLVYRGLGQLRGYLTEQGHAPTS